MNRISRIALAAAVGALAAACSRPGELPDMGLSRTTLAFEAPGASGEPAAQAVWVTNTGRGSLAAPTVGIEYVDGSGWLSAAVAGGGAPYRVDVQPATAGLDPGVYRATLTIACANASASPVQVNVTLTVPDARFVLSGTALAFDALEPGDPAPQSFQVLNGGRGVLPVPQVEVDYVGTATGWLDSVVRGSADAYTITVSAHATSLDTGVYDATLRVRAADGLGGPPRTLAVKLTVGPAKVAVSQRQLQLPLVRRSFDVFATDLVSLEITNTGPGHLGVPQVTVPWSGFYLWTEVVGTQEPYTLRMEAYAGLESLETGTYHREIHVSAPDASNVETVSVSLYVPPPQLQLSAAQVSWTQFAGCPLAGPQVVRVTNAGFGKLARPTVSVPPEAQGWLETSLTGDRPPFRLVLAPKAPPPFDPEAGGTVTTTLVLEAPGSQPVSLAVRLTALPSPWTLSQAAPSPLIVAAQEGLGDPGPATLSVRTLGGCIPPPSVDVTYAASTDPAWLTTRIVSAIQRHDVLVGASVAGMAAGDERGATLHLTGGLAQDVPVTVRVGALRVTGATATARAYGHAVTPLPDGRALVTGGSTSGATLASAEVYDPASGTFAPFPSMSHPREGHLAVVLEGGKVLVCGGWRSGSGPDPTCELTVGGTWSVVGSYSPHFWVDDLVALPGDRVLALSGDQALWIDPWSLGELATPAVTDSGQQIYAARAVTLPDGRLLASGSYGNAYTYDPVLDRWDPTGSMAVQRSEPALVGLADGRVLALGGLQPGAEIWDPATGLWTPAAPPPTSHRPHSVVALSNGLVLAFAGTAEPAALATGDVEVYDPIADSWSVAATLPGVERSGHTVAVRLASGMVLVVGGWRQTEPYGPIAEAIAW